MAKQVSVKTETAVAKLADGIQTSAPMKIEDLIIQSAQQLGMALPEHMRPERIIRIALTTLRTNPRLYECEPKSILAALFQSAQLGLEPNLNGEAWIIPYNVSYKLPNGGWGKRMMAQFQIGVYGLVKLFWNHMNSIALTIESVHSEDVFEYDLGAQQLKHVPPAFGRDRGEVVGYYAAALLTNGGRSIKVMSRQEVEKHAKQFSKCFNKKENKFMEDTPWHSHFDAMAKVTVLKQLLKVLPKSVEIQRALAMDGTIKTTVASDMGNVPAAAVYEDILSPGEPDSSGGIGGSSGELSTETQPAKEVQVSPAGVPNKQTAATVPVFDVLEAQLNEIEIKGTAKQLHEWFASNVKKFPTLNAEQKKVLLGKYQKALKDKEK
jgi:recombination protein RecT